MAKNISKSMLTPMETQYLVGLCCLKTHPEAVDITVGDMVMDEAEEEERDVDVTVTLSEANGTKSAFKVFEVKKEKRRLDVTKVEQLCIKLNDMPSITHRAIVSSSGFANGAIKKAKKHNVDLFEFRPWTKSLSKQFNLLKNVGHVDELLHDQGSFLLYWMNPKIHLYAKVGPRTFMWQNSDILYSSNGKLHPDWVNLSAFIDKILFRSTDILFKVSPASDIFNKIIIGAENEEHEWHHTHTMDVFSDEVFLNVNNRLTRITEITITGSLQWKRQKNNKEYFILENIQTGEAFAGAIISSYGASDDRMSALIFSPDSNGIGVHPTINLSSKHKNIIRNLYLRQNKKNAIF
jgi:hypothetical protein